MDKPPSLASDLSGVPESPVEGDATRAILARRTRYPRGHHIKPHWHSRAQFLFAVEGTMRVRTPRHVWIVPPSRALWLPARTAQVFMLREHAGFETAEICEKLEITSNHCWVLLYRARMALRECLEKDWFGAKGK